MHGFSFAGTHLIIDMWGGQKTDDQEHVAATLRAAASASGADLVSVNLHQFQPRGLTGVAILQESHLTIHVWPEIDYTAIDMFTCGAADPYQIVPIIRAAFLPEQLQIAEHKRGVSILE